MPEEGDMNFLAEVIELNKESEVCILTSDKDFTVFAEPLLAEFGVEVFGKRVDVERYNN